MKLRAFVIVVLSSCSFAAWSQLGEKNFSDKPYIEVSGKAEMEIVPDEIYLKIIINEKDTKNKVSLDDLEKQMLAKLKAIGIESKDVMIRDMSSNFKFYLLAKTDVLLTREYLVLVHDGKTATRVLVDLEKIGVSNVSVDRVDHSKIEEYRQEVKVNAIKAARQKALALTKAIDQTAGKAIYILEQDIVPYRNSNTVMIRGTSSMYGAKAADIELDFEKIHLESTMLCRFELN